MTPHVFVAKVRDILRDNASSRFIGNQRSGIVDEARLGLAPTGTDRVFKRPLARRYSRYHVAMMLDASGSMSHNNRTAPCLTMACGISKALTEAGAKVTPYAFNRKMRTLRLSHIVDDYNATLNATDKQAGGNSRLYSGNHDPYFIEKVGRSLIADKEYPGKILLVLSDGSPSCDDYHPTSSYRCTLPGCIPRSLCTDPKKSPMPALLSFLDRAGVITLSIGIGTDYVGKVYGEKRSAVCTDATVYASVAKLLESHLTRG